MSDDKSSHEDCTADHEPPHEENDVQLTEEEDMIQIIENEEEGRILIHHSNDEIENSPKPTRYEVPLGSGGADIPELPTEQDTYDETR